MADPDALRFTSELMLRTKGCEIFWTCSADSAERFVIRVLTTPHRRNAQWAVLRRGISRYTDNVRVTSFTATASCLGFPRLNAATQHCAAGPRRRTATVHTATRNACYQPPARLSRCSSRAESVWPPYYDELLRRVRCSLCIAAERPELESPATTYTVNARRQQRAQGPAPSNTRWGR